MTPYPTDPSSPTPSKTKAWPAVAPGSPVKPAGGGHRNLQMTSVVIVLFVALLPLHVLRNSQEYYPMSMPLSTGHILNHQRSRNIPSPPKPPNREATETGQAAPIPVSWHPKGDGQPAIPPVPSETSIIALTARRETCESESAPLLRPSAADRPSIRDYAEFHRGARKCYGAARRAAEFALCPPALVWRCRPGSACCGLGDRVNTVAMGFHVALMTRRAFFIEWPTLGSPFPLDVGFAPAFVDWRPMPSFSDVYRQNRTRNGSELTYEWVYWGNARNLTYKGRNGTRGSFNLETDDAREVLRHVHVIEGYTRLPNDQVSRSLHNPTLGGHLSDLREIHPLGSSSHAYVRVLHQTLFRASPAVERVVREVGFAPNTPYVALHLRIGLDYGEARPARFRQFINYDIGEFAADVVQCARALAPEAAKSFFVASDSIRAKDTFFEVARKIGVREVRTISRASMHIAKAHASHTNAEDRCQGYIDVFGDAFMLGGARLLLTTGSFLSHMAHALSDDVEIHRVNTTTVKTCRMVSHLSSGDVAA